MPRPASCNGFCKAGFVDCDDIALVESQVLQEGDNIDDVIGLLEESGLLDQDVGVIDSDDDFES
ncbi:hypothetical protein PC128_g6642 [Phytophthora cactorum]|nr:hypothetical protein PC120_g3636 [Phytophthora cactorum]KAG3081770.1 hypothetical protein PC121_g6344 [Phytophthora cactorum]KAG3197641.1 hypothetical protein PC128_g6642 [Phytophthora cactorum]KAG4060805.1 hypothetical protein PC123_g4287 [Phytophthora cactorum]